MNIDVDRMLKIGVDELLGESVAVLGIKGSGKSNTAAVLTEELLAARVPVCVIDIAGEYAGLKERYPDLFVVGNSLTPERMDKKYWEMDTIKEVGKRAYKAAQSLVLDVSAFDKAARLAFVGAFVQSIWDTALHLRQPYTFLLEEAHNYVPQSGSTPVTDLFVDVAAEGRKRGLGIIMVGQRSARIDKNVLTQAGVLFLHRVQHSADTNVYAELIPNRKKSDVVRSVRGLKTGEALVVRGERATRHMIRLRRTPHYGYTPSMSDLPSDRGVRTVDELTGISGEQLGMGFGMKRETVQVYGEVD